MLDGLDIYSPDFGLKVKKMLLDLDVTQSDIARDLKLSRAYVSDILYCRKDAYKRRREIVDYLNLKEIEKERGFCEARF